MVFKIKVRAEVRPTEDIEKIKNAVKNLLAFKEEEFRIIKEEEEYSIFKIAKSLILRNIKNIPDKVLIFP